MLSFAILMIKTQYIYMTGIFSEEDRISTEIIVVLLGINTIYRLIFGHSQMKKAARQVVLVIH